MNQPDPVDTNRDGVLQCGDVEDLTGYEGGQGLMVDVPTGTGIELRTDFANPAHVARLATETDSSLARALEIWDPQRNLRVIPGYQEFGATLVLELVVVGGGTIDGTLSVDCDSAGEVCFNVTDDDGDGRIDCADVTCARNLDCVADQEDLEQVELSCGDTLVPLDPPVLGNLDDQRTVYGSNPGEPGEPPHEFWGGGELVIVGAEADGQITLTFDSAGLACPGTDADQNVSCIDPVRVEPGSDYVFDTAALPLWLEPLDLGWAGLAARLDCT